MPETGATLQGEVGGWNTPHSSVSRQIVICINAAYAHDNH